MTEAPDPPFRRDHPHLLRVLGLVFGLAVVVGGMVGSGIMRAPGVVAQGITSPSLILLAWAGGGLIALLSAMPVVEAGTSVPMAGGPFPIAGRAFGPQLAFFTGWIDWLQYAASNAFIAVVFGEYVHRLGWAGGVSTGALAAAMVLAVGVVNLLPTRLSGGSQSLASALKGAAFIGLVAILMGAPGAAAPPPSAAHVAAITSVGAAIMAIRVIYQTYAGWNAAIYFSEEVQRPDRNVARSTFGGVAAVTLLYVAVNAAALHVLPVSAIAGSQLAVGDALKVPLGPGGDRAMTLIGLLSLAAIVNLQTMAAPRILWRMAVDGALPQIFAKVSRAGAPWVGVLVTALGGAAFAATGTYESIVRIYAPWTMAAILIVCLSAIQLRRREPDLPRPYRMPLYPLPALLGAAIQAGLIVVVVADDPTAGALSLIAAVAPLPIYLIFARRWARGAGRMLDPAANDVR